MSKRGNGEGSIYQRAGRKGWFASVTVDGRRKILHADTRREVDALLTAAKTAKEAGGLIIGKSPTIEAFLAQWLAEVIKPNRSAWTWRGYRAAIDNHIVPVIGKIKVERLTPQHVLGLMARMREGGASPKTIANVRVLLRSALTTAVKWNLAAVNVAAKVDPPKAETHEIHPFTRAEAKTFLAAVSGDRLEALYTVALTMGMRQGEALGLRWEDVDLEAGTLAIREQLQRVDGKLTRVPLKTPKSRRTLTMPAPAVAALRAHRERQRGEGRALLPSAYVFTNTVGKPMEARRVVTEFKAILRRAGLRDVRFHDLRHSAATLLLVQGVSPRVVMEILGHSQMSTTTNTYQHVVPELQREAADRMSALFV
jgi:integrase